MTMTQTIEVTANRRTFKVPREIPAGRVIVTFAPEKAPVEDCPLCAKYRDPKSGALIPNAETIAAMKEVDDMLAGKIPNTLKSFNSLEEMLADLDSDD